MSERLDELYQMRAFIDDEIEIELRLAAQPGIGRPIQAAAHFYGITVAELLSPSRERRIVLARQAAAWLLRAKGMSYPEIGRALGRDHTTILHSVRAVERNPAMRELVRGIEVAA